MKNNIGFRNHSSNGKKLSSIEDTFMEGPFNPYENPLGNYWYSHLDNRSQYCAYINEWKKDFIYICNSQRQLGNETYTEEEVKEIIEGVNKS